MRMKLLKPTSLNVAAADEVFDELFVSLSGSSSGCFFPIFRWSLTSRADEVCQCVYVYVCICVG